MSADLNRKLRWLIALRLLIVISIVGPYSLVRLSADEDVDAALGAAADTQAERDDALAALAFAACAMTLVYIALLRPLVRRPSLHAYLQFCGDLALITYLIVRLGDAGQSFSILYFVVISVASVLLRRSAGIVIATLASLCVTAMMWTPSWAVLESLQRVLSLEDSPLAKVSLPMRIYSQSIHLAGFYAVAILTSYLARNITRVEERLRAKQIDLAYLEVVHRDIIQSISSGLVTTDLNGTVTSLNRSAEKIFERRAEDVIGVHITETGIFGQSRWRELNEASTDGATRTELSWRKGDRSAYLGLTLSHLRDGDNERRGYIVVVEDLTQERQLREQLRLKDRMAAIGEMATKLAHEVGNPLAAISGSVQVLSGSFDGDPSQQKLLEITLKESKRLDRTVKSFLRLASSRQRRFGTIDISALLAEDIELLKVSDEVRGNHRIEVELEPSSAVIRADPDQIGQIFWNLARNALHAMPEGGTLRVTGRLSDSVYRIAFYDTGSGMSDEAKADLFHPFKSFFDQGTGIGMAIVYRIVEEHGGRIRAESRPGQGTVVHVELPVGGPSADEGAVELSMVDEGHAGEPA